MVVTAEAGDAEMAARIQAHRLARPSHWRTVEAPLDLAAAIGAASAPDAVVLVDCLTLWLSNLFMAGRHIEEEFAGLIAALDAAPGPLVLVSNDVGSGVVPASELGRRFRDEQGRHNQLVAEHCDHVVFVAAGLPVLMKPSPTLTITV
jgi:adenosylcobinamide kinase/adenosylcobinamide-phosphate guanylyltransferase